VFGGVHQGERRQRTRGIGTLRRFAGIVDADAGFTLCSGIT